MTRLLDIITITRDDPEGVRNTIGSTRTLRQNFGQDVGQIIVDSSATATGENLRDSLATEVSLRYLWQNPCGIAPAFNFGLSEGEGEWVWFLNGRDEVHPTLGPALLLDILRQTRADLVIFEMEFMQSGARYQHPPLPELWPPVYNWIPHPATIIRRRVFESFGVFDENYRIAPDGEFWFRSLASSVVVDLVSIPVARYDETGISSRNLGGTAVEVVSIHRRYLKSILCGWFDQGRRIYSALRHFKKVAQRRPP